MLFCFSVPHTFESFFGGLLFFFNRVLLLLPILSVSMLVHTYPKLDTLSSLWLPSSSGRSSWTLSSYAGSHILSGFDEPCITLFSATPSSRRRGRQNLPSSTLNSDQDPSFRVVHHHSILRWNRLLQHWRASQCRRVTIIIQLSGCHHARSLQLSVATTPTRFEWQSFVISLGATIQQLHTEGWSLSFPPTPQWGNERPITFLAPTRGGIVIHTGWWRPCLLIIIRQQSHHRYRRTIVINIVILVTIIVIIVTIIIIIVIIILLIILPRRYHPLNPTIYIIRDTEGQHLHSPPTPLIIQGNV